MPAVQTNLTIEQGADWSHGWRVTYNGAPIDGTWTARSQVRRDPGSPDVLHELAASVNADGSVVIAIPAAVSSAFEWRYGRYDVEATNADASVRLRVASGTVTISPEVTR